MILVFKIQYDKEASAPGAAGYKFKRNRQPSGNVVGVENYDAHGNSIQSAECRFERRTFNWVRRVFSDVLNLFWLCCALFQEIC